MLPALLPILASAYHANRGYHMPPQRTFFAARLMQRLMLVNLLEGAQALQEEATHLCVWRVARSQHSNACKGNAAPTNANHSGENPTGANPTEPALHNTHLCAVLLQLGDPCSQLLLHLHTGWVHNWAGWDDWQGHTRSSWDVTRHAVPPASMSFTQPVQQLEEAQALKLPSIRTAVAAHRQPLSQRLVLLMNHQKTKWKLARCNGTKKAHRQPLCKRLVLLLRQMPRQYPQRAVQLPLSCAATLVDGLRWRKREQEQGCVSARVASCVTCAAPRCPTCPWPGRWSKGAEWGETQVQLALPRCPPSSPPRTPSAALGWAPVHQPTCWRFTLSSPLSKAHRLQIPGACLVFKADKLPPTCWRFTLSSPRSSTNWRRRSRSSSRRL